MTNLNIPHWSAGEESASTDQAKVNVNVPPALVMNRIKEIERINTREVEAGVSDAASWHAEYKHSAYVIAAGLDYRLSEGDLITVFSQCGEVVDLNLIRDKVTGKSCGFAFIAYEDQRSTILAVDNFNGAKLLGRLIRVDHVRQYRRPKSSTEAGAEGVNEADEDYDERRRRIWDYEAYEAPPLSPVSPVDDASKVTAAAPEEQDVQRQAQRIEEIRRRRQARREQQRREEQRADNASRRPTNAS